MTRNQPAVDLPVELADEGAPDPELTALPEPRRPGRRLTIAAMALTAALSLVVAVMLRSQAAYSFAESPPIELDNLAQLDPNRATHANKWVHGEALLGSVGAVRYGRPLDSDSFRLAPVAGNPKIWVEIRVPRGMEGPRFVPPTSFVGRLVPMQTAGLGNDGLAGAGIDIPRDAWLLIDGDTPASNRWALGVIALFIAFAAFNVWGLVRILRPVRDA